MLTLSTNPTSFISTRLMKSHPLESTVTQPLVPESQQITPNPHQKGHSPQTVPCRCVPTLLTLSSLVGWRNTSAVRCPTCPLLLGMSYRQSYPRADDGFGELQSGFEDPDPALNTPKPPNCPTNMRVEEGIWISTKIPPWGETEWRRREWRIKETEKSCCLGLGRWIYFNSSQNTSNSTPEHLPEEGK